MQILSISIAIVLLFVFIAPIFSGVHNLGMAAGILLGLCFGAEGIFYDKMNFTTKKYTVFALFGKNNTSHQKTVIILGCRVKGDVPSVALQKRADEAYFYLLQNPNSIAVLSGGQGKDENISEALCLKKLLCDRGIEAKRLYCEELSTSTDENIRFSKQIIDENGFCSDVVIVTSEYHQFRARKICEKYGLTPYQLSSKTQPILLPTFLLRELMAIINEMLK